MRRITNNLKKGLQQKAPFGVLLGSGFFIFLAFQNCTQDGIDANFTSVGSAAIPTGNVPVTISQSQVQLNPMVNAVAFEDLYYPPGKTPSAQPDFDYNDFMTEFKVVEKTDSNSNITDIYIDFYPRAVGAGSDHIFYLVLTGKKSTPSANSNLLPTTAPMFNGSAQVTMTYYDENGVQVGQPTNPAYDKDIVVFPSTHEAFGIPSGKGSGLQLLNTSLPNGYTSGIPSNYVMAKLNPRIHISIDDPTLNPAPTSGTIDPSTFRVILHPIPSNYDIDIIDVDPTNFAGTTGYPWGFIIPTDWQWMVEKQNITNGYPELTQFRNHLMGKPATGDYMNWFNYPVQNPKVVYPAMPWTMFLPPIP